MAVKMTEILIGHLKFFFIFHVETLVDTGTSLVSDLLHDFLFPASKMMLDSMNQPSQDTSLSEFNPK